MFKSWKITGGGLLLAALGWFFHQTFQVDGLDNVQVRQRGETTGGARSSRGDRPPEGARTTGGTRGITVSHREPPAERRPAPRQPAVNGTLRIASFNIQVFGEKKLDQEAVVDLLVDVVRHFDVVAIQEIRSTRQDIMPRFVNQLNAGGRAYDFVIGPRLGRTSSKEQYAYVFDTQTVDIDPNSVYTLSDPQDVLHREPLVAGFRARGPRPDEAFTFTLINVHTDPDEATQEVDVLDDVVRAVRNDGRNEDDVILLGDLNVDAAHLGALGRMPDMLSAITGVATNTRGNRQYDHILFSRRATTEFTGLADVFDLKREYQLSVEQALAVSDHLPVWAEFDLYEGAGPGRVAWENETPRR